MFLLWTESLEVGYDLSLRRHNQEGYSILKQVYYGEGSRFSLLEKPQH